DSQGFAYVVGRTRSADFPTLNPLQPILRGRDVFVTKIDPTGSSLVWSTFLGGTVNSSGSTAEECGLAIAIASGDEAVVVGYTEAVDFPVTANAAQPTFAGRSEIFAARLSSSGSSLVWSTYLGGSGVETSPGVGYRDCDVAVDSAGNAVVCGRTESTDLPTVNAMQPANAGHSDLLVAVYAPSGTLLTSTYFGGSGFDGGVQVAIAATDEIYLAGPTQSFDMPTTPGAWSGGLGRHGYVARLAPLARRIIAASSFPAVPVSLALGPSGQVFVCGTTHDRAFVRTLGSVAVRWNGDATYMGFVSA